MEGCGSGHIGGVTAQFEWMLVNNELQRKWKVAVVASYTRICFERLSKIKETLVMIALPWSRFEPGNSREMLSLEAAFLAMLLI